MSYCQRKISNKDEPGKTYMLDGEFIGDLPSFYLSLGEAINGENGYFGTCLDSLSDCLFGGFGAKLPIEIIIINGEGVKETLVHTAWIRMTLENRLRYFEDPDATHSQLLEWGVCDMIDPNGQSFLPQLQDCSVKKV
jgi:RNAse (barnase) inhibitor barstar